MAWAPDSPDSRAPDSWLAGAWAPDSGSGRLNFRRAVELFLEAKGAEGASPKTLEWYRMVLGRAARELGTDRTLDALTPAEVRDWLLSLRRTLAPISVAGYVRGLKVFGNWCAADELAEAKALRTLRRPRVPHKMVEPLTDDALRRLLDGASIRDRAILLLFLDTGLRLSELAGLRTADLRVDGSVKVMGKGARERIVPVGTTARQALVRYLRANRAPESGASVFRSDRGGARGARGIQQAFRRMKLRVRHPRALQSAHLAPHLRPFVSGQWRRRVQPAAHPGPRHAGHGQALRGARRYRPRAAPPGGVASRSADGERRLCVLNVHRPASTTRRPDSQRGLLGTPGLSGRRSE